jgi:hypothetical protein
MGVDGRSRRIVPSSASLEGVVVVVGWSREILPRVKSRECVGVSIFRGGRNPHIVR